MPCEEAKGLLPGRGAPGFRAVPACPGLGAAGPGRGAAGRGVAVGVGEEVCMPGWKLGRCGAGFGAGLAGPGTGPGVAFGAVGVGALGVTFAVGALGVCSTAGAGAGTAGFAGAGFAGAFAGAASVVGAEAPPPEELTFSVTLRTTGASIVDEADFTNSPMSFKRVNKSLLVSPSSFASSWTRTLATTLLQVRVFSSGPVSCCDCSFLGTHRVVMSVSPLSGCIGREPMSVGHSDERLALGIIVFVHTKIAD